MEDRVRDVIDAEWQARLGVNRPTLRGGGVHIVSADLGANDAMSFLLEDTCIVVVPIGQIDAAQEVLAGIDIEDAFTANALQMLVGPDARVDGPSWHSYVDGSSFRGAPDRAAFAVDGGDAALLAFLEQNHVADWAESGFPLDPRSADPATTTFWVLPNHGRGAAAANMTEWRGLPADVGVLTSPAERRRGFARRLVGAMVAATLPAVGVVRYRALASNAASLAVARGLGLEHYGQNFRARKPTS